MRCAHDCTNALLRLIGWNRTGTKLKHMEKSVWLTIYLYKLSILYYYILYINNIIFIYRYDIMLYICNIDI
jgi:hypothetical protein